ncbi:thiamine phosphate synthase [Inquilinus sp. CA228]|uniref:thiamine phosphate synthase n=1 Tax=Inquilinus sp. CA228 TaxID=3455609 RepID=UPI003F8D566A
MMLDRFYPVVDHADWVARLAPIGAKFVQLRIKDRPEDDIRRQVREAKAAAAAYGAQLILNDYWRIALEEGCDWVHLGQGDLDGADLAALRGAGIKFGISTHDDAELERALAAEPDYVALGPIYETYLKEMLWPPQGLDRIGIWKRKLGPIPLVAIGGLTPDRLPGVFLAGANSAAVSTDIIRNADPEWRTRQWIEATRAAGRSMVDRYSRQTMLPEVGPERQALVAKATVLVVGVGGLGAPVLQYLAGAGVGRLIIVDRDRIEEHNLHRQPLFRMADIGCAKVDAARDALLALNPFITVDARCERLVPNNAASLVAAADIVVDAADSFAVTYILNDACKAADKPLVSASVIGLKGYVGTFCGGSPSYRAVFPDMPQQAQNCATAGVLGTAVAVMGSLQAHAVLSLILGLQSSLEGRVVSVDFQTLAIRAFSFHGAVEDPEALLPFISPSDVTNEDIVIDLRGLDEAPASPFPRALRMSVDDVGRGEWRPPDEAQRVVLCCRSGIRAARAATMLRTRGHRELALVALG